MMSESCSLVQQRTLDHKWLQKLVDTMVKLQGYRNWRVEMRDIDGNSCNYLGQLYEISIKGVTDNGEKEIDLFVKEKITVEFKYISIKDVYKTETFVYDEISNILANLQNKYAVPEEEQFKFAKAYGGISEDIIILENLRMRGFKSPFRMDAVSFPFASLAVRQLGKLHALSFVLEHDMPEYFNMHIKSMKSHLCFDDDWKKGMNNMFVAIAYILDDNDKKRKFLKFESRFVEKFPQYFKSDEKRKCTFLHGDCNINNLMAREQDGTPVEVLLVDYQLADYSCPIRDLLTFIGTGTDQEFRRTYLNVIKELYFDSMSNFLEHFNLHIENVYPREEFETAYNECLDFGFMIGLIYCVLFLIPEKEKLVYKTCSYSEVCYNTSDKRFKKRVTELIDDYIEWGCL